MSQELKIAQLESKVTDLIKHQDIIEVRLDTKIAWKHFFWIIGTLLAFQSTLIGYLITEVRDIKTEVKDVKEYASENKSTISRIEGILENAEVTN